MNNTNDFKQSLNGENGNELLMLALALDYDRNISIITTMLHKIQTKPILAELLLKQKICK